MSSTSRTTISATDEGGRYWFDDAAADRAVAFFPEMLRHSKGEWAGRPMVLAPWQEDEVIRPLFGWKRPDGTRRFRQVYIEVPRKNGKSTLAAGVAIYLLFADGEPGADIYSAAADAEQAGIVFGIARAMVARNRLFEQRSISLLKSIVVPSTGSSYKSISADSRTKLSSGRTWPL